MKRANITSIICILASITMWNLCGIHAEAGVAEKALESFYRQIVTERKNIATVNYDGDMISIDDIQLYINSKDDPENLFDGKVACERGKYHSEKRGATHTLTIIGGYDVEEADRLTDEMVKEISRNLEANASDRMKMAAISDYISETYNYDHETADRIETNVDGATTTNFVDAYYGNKNIVCGDFASLTYILANKMGIDCEMIYGVDHVYNMVKFSDSVSYIGYDLSSDTRYAQITLADYYMNDLYHLENASGDTTRCDPETEIKMNNGATYKCAGIKDIVLDFIYFAFTAHHIPEILIIGAAIVLIVVKIIHKINTAKRNRRKNARVALKRKASRA